MIRLVDITYYSHTDLQNVAHICSKHRPSTRYSDFLPGDLDVTFIMHAGFEATEEYDGITYHVFKGFNKFHFLPFKGCGFIARHRADVVLVQGLGFPVQVMLLKLICPSVKILAQHHCERPFAGVKLLFQRLAAKHIDGWLFTAKGNALLWKQKKVIKPDAKIFEVLEASTELQPLDYSTSRKQLAFNSDDRVFLWVGRLIAHKSPLLVLEAFAEYLLNRPNASLYLIYQDEQLLAEIKAVIRANPILAKKVHLTGKVAHHELARWFSAADYYISASMREGSGYALIEAMACGCTPVISDIPPFCKITANGRMGKLYQTGSAKALLNALLNLPNPPAGRQVIIDHFNKNLSFQTIAGGIAGAAKNVCSNKFITRSAISSAENVSIGS